MGYAVDIFSAFDMIRSTTHACYNILTRVGILLNMEVHCISGFYSTFFLIKNVNNCTVDKCIIFVPLETLYKFVIYSSGRSCYNTMELLHATSISLYNLQLVFLFMAAIEKKRVEERRPRKR